MEIFAELHQIILGIGSKVGGWAKFKLVKAIIIIEDGIEVQLFNSKVLMALLVNK